MTQNWIDIGVNLTNSRFDNDREQVIERARGVGVTQQLVTGTNVCESQAAWALTQSYPQQLFSTAGCHPHDAKNLDAAGLATIKSLLSKPEVVAIGECGLDFNRDFSPRETQIEVFKQQLALAESVQKPLFLHERDAFDQQFALLSACMSRLVGGVTHCFTGNLEQMEAYLSIGLYIGITGWICDERRGLPLLEIVKQIPDDRLLLETDAPFLTPRDLRPKPKGGRNEPAFLPHIAQRVAEVRNQSLATLSELTIENTRRLFRLEPAHDSSHQ